MKNIVDAETILDWTNSAAITTGLWVTWTANANLAKLGPGDIVLLQLKRSPDSGAAALDIYALELRYTADY
jgi:hypothetical protein